MNIRFSRYHKRESSPYRNYDDRSGSKWNFLSIYPSLQYKSEL